MSDYNSTGYSTPVQDLSTQNGSIASSSFVPSPPSDPSSYADGTDEGTTHATILLMGLRRCGKSSISKVVFHNMQPLDTLYLESTSKPTVISNKMNKNLINLSIMELPGQMNFFEPNYDHEAIFKKVGALIYIIDSQDEYLNAITNLAMIAEYAHKVNPKLNIEVLIHKIDGLNEDFKLDTQRDIMQRVGDELMDLGIDASGEDGNNGISINFYLTSIFDHSIYEALSRIVQKLIPELPFLENMLDNLVLHSDLEKAFLFDINSKIYVSTDSSPVDIQTYEVCSEFVDVTLDLEDLYASATTTTTTTNTDDTQRREIKSFSKLNNGLCIYMKEMIRGLALVALVRLKDHSEGAGAQHSSHHADSNDNKTINEYLTVIDYNVEIFKHSLEQIWNIK